MKVEYKGKEYDVKYHHERYTDEQDVIRPKGGKTVAYINLDEENTLSAFAECSLKDVYVKKLGRRISLGRLRKLLKQ